MISLNVNGTEFRCYDHIYAVSACGKALRKMAPYEPTKRRDGYLQLGRRRLMHRVVATCWCDKPEGAIHVHHRNGDRSDNRADNLEWVSVETHTKERHDFTNNGKFTRSPETRAKLSAARAGKRDSPETRAKKAAILDAVRVKRRPVKFQGISYPSVSAAARAVGLHLSTFRLWHLSECFPVDDA